MILLYHKNRATSPIANIKILWYSLKTNGDKNKSLYQFRPTGL